jgi:hypothetical protein
MQRLVCGKHYLVLTLNQVLFDSWLTIQVVTFIFSTF